MNVTQCPNCATVFELAGIDLAASGGRVRCGECRTVFAVHEDEAAPTAMSGERARDTGYTETGVGWIVLAPDENLPDDERADYVVAGDDAAWERAGRPPGRDASNVSIDTDEEPRYDDDTPFETGPEDDREFTETAVHEPVPVLFELVTGGATPVPDAASWADEEADAVRSDSTTDDSEAAAEIADGANGAAQAESGDRETNGAETLTAAASESETAELEAAEPGPTATEARAETSDAHDPEDDWASILDEIDTLDEDPAGTDDPEAGVLDVGHVAADALLEPRYRGPDRRGNRHRRASIRRAAASRTRNRSGRIGGSGRARRPGRMGSSGRASRARGSERRNGPG